MPGTPAAESRPTGSLCLTKPITLNSRAPRGAVRHYARHACYFFQPRELRKRRAECAGLLARGGLAAGAECPASGRFLHLERPKLRPKVAPPVGNGADDPAAAFRLPGGPYLRYAAALFVAARGHSRSSRPARRRIL